MYLRYALLKYELMPSSINTGQLWLESAKEQMKSLSTWTLSAELKHETKDWKQDLPDLYEEQLQYSYTEF